MSRTTGARPRSELALEIVDVGHGNLPLGAAPRQSGRASTGDARLAASVAHAASLDPPTASRAMAPDVMGAGAAPDRNLDHLGHSGHLDSKARSRRRLGGWHPDRGSEEQRKR